MWECNKSAAPESSNVLGHIKESLINADKQQLTDVNNS